jgi:uncharacterized protein
MARTYKVLAGLAALSLLLITPVAVYLSEGAVHIPARRRFAAHTELADRIAQANAATWRESQITAADGILLKAWEFRPHHWNGATVLVLHGHFDTREGTSGFAPLLLKHGYAALVPDNRGHGTSGGDEVTYGVRERDDVRRWVGFAAGEKGGGRVYGLGQSMGAAILLQSLAGESRIRAAVAEGAFTGFRAVAYQRVGGRFGLPPSLSALFVEPAFLYLRARYGVALDQASPIDAIRQSKTPILYIHGTGDTNIEPANSRELLAARPAGSELWQPARATHIKALAYYPEEFERRVIGWFDRH